MKSKPKNLPLLHGLLRTSLKPTAKAGNHPSSPKPVAKKNAAGDRLSVQPSSFTFFALFFAGLGGKSKPIFAVARSKVR